MKNWLKITKKVTWSRFSSIFCVLAKCKKNKIFGYLSSGLKILKIEAENAQEMFSRPSRLVEGIVTSGLGPWGCPRATQSIRLKALHKA